jgi:hypothetical protein
MTPLAFHLPAALLTFGSTITLAPLDLHATDFTIATYVYLSDTERRNIVLGNWSSHDNAWQMLVAVNAGGKVALNLRRDMQTNGSDPMQDLVALTSRNALYAWGWEHIAVTFSWGQDRKSPKATLYLNGNVEATATPQVVKNWRIQNPYTLKRSPNDYLIGHKEDTNTADDWFSGQLCEFRIYTRALNTTQLGAMLRESDKQFNRCFWDIQPVPPAVQPATNNPRYQRPPALPD